MYYFVNDYNDIGSPEVLEALMNAAGEYNPGYGFDDHCENARKLIKNALADENVDIHFIPGGTGANILGIATGMRQQDSVIAVKSGHIEGHETGSIEATGIKIETINSENGKLSRKLIEDKLDQFGEEYTTIPKKVYISNTTELGEVYTKAEIMEIYDLCKERDMYLFIDGARISHALASDKCDYDIRDLTKMCDIFYIGGTKNSLPLGEALIIVNDDLKKDFINLQKQKGAMLAKSFLVGIMFETQFKTSESFLKGAHHAFEMSEKLAKALEEKSYQLAYPHESNQVFVKVTDDQLQKWSKIAKFLKSGKEDDMTIVRLVTTYRTSEEDIDGFVSKI